jgi:hypothetical protein
METVEAVSVNDLIIRLVVPNSVSKLGMFKGIIHLFIFTTIVCTNPKKCPYEEITEEDEK